MDNNSKTGLKNKGLSLLEILIGVCLMAIVLMPISSCLLTSLKITLKSRTLMTATDVGQCIVEDISEKTFEECMTTLASVGAAGKLRSAGQIGFASIDGDYYNKAGNTQQLSFPAGVTSVGISTVTIGGVTYFTKDLVADNKGLNNQFAAAMKTAISANPSMKKLVYSTDSNGILTFMGYTGLNSKGKTFDVVISFMPVAQLSTDVWYSYEVFVDVYEYKGNSSATRLSGSPTVSFKTGIRSKD